MSAVRELHNKAMQLAQRALIARHQGKEAEAEDLARQACDFESRAAQLIPLSEESEPTRSILYRSAASLAYQGKEYVHAIKLIMQGLSGFPPNEIYSELKELFEKVRFEEHLLRDDLIMSEDDIHLTLQGGAVGPGLIQYNQFVKRIKTIPSIIYRTTERLLGKAYQKAGRPSSKTARIVPAVMVPQGGCFSVTVRLVYSKGQILLSQATPNRVVDEIMTSFELLNDMNLEELANLMQDETYLRNFLSLAGEMAPDGNDITLLGLSSSKRKVGFVRTHNEIASKTALPTPPTAVQQEITVIGELDFATKRAKNLIGLTVEGGTRYDIKVEEGMEDLVRAYFSEWVKVAGLFDGKLIYLSSIQPADPADD